MRGQHTVNLKLMFASVSLATAHIIQYKCKKKHLQSVTIIKVDKSQQEASINNRQKRDSGDDDYMKTGLSIA